MRYRLTRRFFLRRLSNFKTCIVGLLIFCVCASLLTPERGASAQSGCNVECSATVAATAQIGAQVSFMASATVSGCASAPAYEWDFGDGTSTSLQQNVTHTYTAPGVYTWKLTATARAGATTINTVAGGYGDNVLARQAPFITPVAVARDPQGRGFYIADDLSGNTLLRFVNTGNSSAAVGGKTIDAGKIRLLAGESGVPIQQEVWDVPASNFVYTIRGLATSANGNLLYFSDEGNGQVLVYNASNNDLTVAGRMLKPGNVGTLALAPTGALGGAATHPVSGEVYFISGNIVHKIGSNNQPAAVAGNGATTSASEKFPAMPVDGTAAPLLTPRDIAFDNAGNLFIADSGHGRAVKLDSSNKLSLVFQFQFGAGVANPYPSGIAVISGKVYTANGNDQTITEVSAAGAIVAGKSKTTCNYISSTCGDGGAGANALFNLPGSSTPPPIAGIESDENGLYILDQGGNQTGRVRYLNLGAAPTTLAGVVIAANNIDTIAGSGLASPFDGGLAIGGSLSFPTGVALDANNNLFIADTLAGRLRFVNRGSNVVTLFPNTPAQQIVEPGAIVTINKDVGVGQTDGVPVNQASFDTPQGLFVTNQGVFVADSKGGPSVDFKRSGLIRFINTSPSTVVFYPNSPSPISVPPGHIARVAGATGGVSGGIGNGGSAIDARFFAPADIVVNPVSGDIYVADVGNKAVRRISGNNGTVISLNLPASQYTGLGLDASSRLYIADYDQNRVLRESSAGSGQFAPLNSTPLNKPRDVAVDVGGAAYVTNSDDNRIVRIAPSGMVEIFAGTTANPNAGFDGDGGLATNAKLSIIPDPININAIGAPAALPVTVNIAIGSGGEVVFTDTRNGRVRRIGAGSVTCLKTGKITVTGANPAPALSQITPAYAPLGGRDFTLTINGTGFVTGSKARWNGQDRTTNYVSSTQLIAQIPATDIGVASTASVTVFNPAPGGGVSNALPIVVSQPNPQPALSSLVPNAAAVGTGFTLTLTGSQFTNSSVVRWNGSNRPTTFVSENLLRAEITASDVQSAGAAEVTVFNPEPGGGISSKLTFNVIASNPVPSIAGAGPQAILVGGPAFTLGVRGRDFAITSKVRWNGADRPTAYLSDTFLEAQISGADIANAGGANITVFTPTPGGGVTSTVTVFVGKQAATVPATTFAGNEVSSNSIAALFGSNLATGVEVAVTTPLPTSLLGTTVTIRDGGGGDYPAQLFFVSPSQINYLVPSFITGPAWAIVKSNDNVVGVSEILNRFVSPGLFSANANGKGIAAAVALCVAANGAQTFLPVASYDQTQRQFVGVPLDLTACNGQVYLILYGSGFRQPGGIPDPKVTAKVGGVDVPVLFAGAAPGFVGLDQINIGPLPRALAGLGVVDIVVSVDLQTAGGTNGPKPANTVQVNIK
ncbi:MAG: IPT/TIG domain-containing protein [Blastocatellales bacterium]